MRYYVYRVDNDRRNAELLNEFDAFKEASSYAKEQRANSPADSFVKVMHAKDSREGERLVKEFRQPSWPVEEWE